MEVVRATELVMYRIALWGSFGNKIPTLQQSDWLAISGGAPPKQSCDAIRHKADLVCRTTSTKTKKRTEFECSSYWRRDVIRARRRFSCFQSKGNTFLSYFKTMGIGPAIRIDPTTSWSADNCSTDWANTASVQKYQLNIHQRLLRKRSHPFKSVQLRHHLGFAIENVAKS